jgi:hypothetical protein
MGAQGSGRGPWWPEVSAEAQVEAERLRMLLAEYGYPDAIVDIRPDGTTGMSTAAGEPGAVSPEACWRAYRVIDPEGTPCRSCWDAGAVVGRACLAGDCQARA